MNLPKERVRKIIVLEHLEPYLDFLRVRNIAFLSLKKK